MALRDTQDALLIEAPLASGSLRVTQDALLIEATPSGVGNLRDTQDALLFEIDAPTVSIPYPITPPAISGIGPQDFTMSMMSVVGESVSPFTLGQQEYLWPGQMLTIEANLPPLTMTQAEQWIAFLGALFGKYGTFLMGDYNRATPQGPMSGSPVVNGSNQNGLNVLNIRGAASGVANWGIAGDYIQVTSPGNPQRIYKLLQNASTDGSGDATLQIFPNLRETLVDGLTIVKTNCAGTFRLQENSTQWKVDRNRIYAISFKAKEAI